MIKRLVLLIILINLIARVPIFNGLATGLERKGVPVKLISEKSQEVQPYLITFSHKMNRLGKRAAILLAIESFD